MRITTIHYERKRSDGAYGNRSLSLTAEVDEGEDAALVIGQMALLVRGRLDQDEREEEEERWKREEEERQQQARRRQESAAHRRDQEDPELPEDDDDDDEEVIPF